MFVFVFRLPEYVCFEGVLAKAMNEPPKCFHFFRKRHSAKAGILMRLSTFLACCLIFCDQFGLEIVSFVARVHEQNTVFPTKQKQKTK